MRKLIFTMFVATLSVFSVFAYNEKTLESSVVTWKHSIVSASEESKKSYSVENGYNEISIDITKNSSIAVGTFIITIFNNKEELIGRKEIEAGEISKSNYKKISLASITGESINRIDLYYKGSYTIKFTNLKVIKTIDKIYDYDCVIYHNSEEKSYLPGIAVEQYVVYDLPKDISPRTKKLSFSAKRQKSSVVEGEDMSVWVLVKGSDAYKKIEGWNGRDAAISTDYTKYTVIIPYNAISIKFTNGVWNGSLERYVDEVKIYMGYEEVNTIIWNGLASTEWDNRDNWYRLDGEQLSCADILTESLTVILPAPNSTKYIVPAGGITQYPVLPDLSTENKFKNVRESLWSGKQVNAGDNATATMIADKIYMENGAALVGVETLNAGTLRYNEVEIDFTPVRCYKDKEDSLRYDWTLVGPVVKPWNEDKLGGTRNVVSGDYFLQDLPHVYMHKAEVKEDPKTGLLSAMWNESFPDLDVDLTHERAFAIRIPDQYGRNMDWWGMKFEKLPAEVYNSLFIKEGEAPYDGTAPHTYTFRGRFYNDASLPTYTLPNAGEIVALNNSYPANIDAQKLKAGIGREIQYYDYINKGFVALGGNNKSIMSQSSFIIETKANSEKIEIKREWFETSKTPHRSASVDTESFRIELRNKAASSASEIYICYDPLKEDALNYSVDAIKVFNTMEASLPDLYSMHYNKRLSGLVIPTLSEPIPLGINVSLEDQTFTFSLKECTLSADVILEDRQTNTQYNLSEGEICEVEGLKTGLCEGRFYLLLSEQEEEDPEISTGIDDALIGDIDIYTNGNSVVVSSTSDVELMQVIVSDMAGRTQVYNVSDNYAQINLPVEAGVYTINVIGDKSSRVEKIKLN